jgi:DNA primase
VASSGTSLTEEQIRLIKRYTDNVTVLYDGDQAGIKASFRGIDLLLQEGLNVRAVTFPDGEDPDSYCRKVGADAFQAYLQVEVRDFMSFMLGIKLAEAGKDPLKKAEIVGEIVGSIALIDDTIKRAVYLKECSIQLQMAEDVLIAELNKRLIKKRKEDKQRKELDLPEGVVIANTSLDYSHTDNLISSTDLRSGYESEICRLLLKFGHLPVEEGKYVVDYLFEETSDVPFMAGVYQDFMHEYQSEAKIRPGLDLGLYFTSHEREPLQKLAIQFLTTRYEASESWERYNLTVPDEKDIISHVVVSTVLRLKREHICKLIEENQKVLQDLQMEDESGLYQKIHVLLKQIAINLAGKLGNVIYKK